MKFSYTYNLLFLLIFHYISSQTAFAIDTGDGSDGTCDITGAATTQITAAKRTYQCTTLNINGNLTAFKGTNPAGANGAPLVIKVQGNATVSAGTTVDFSGANGGDGNIVALAPGGKAGAGGGAGGSSSAGAGANGLGVGGGLGGPLAPNTGFADSIGAGGSGGSYQTQGATAPTNGDDNGTAIVAGANGVIFGSEATFDTTFTGGAGGAAGGSGIDTIPNLWFGSSGGGGGGALHIISGGNILVDGTIISKGGDGGGAGAERSSGGGGGASGGAIWLQAAGTLTVSATGVITANGGTFGVNATGFIGSGGDGGTGRIRLDDADGVITNLGSVSPAPFSTSFVPTAISSSSSMATRAYSSTVACGRVTEDFDKSIPINIFIGICIVGLGRMFVNLVTEKIFC